VPEMITIALAFLVFLALLAAVVAIGWLSRVRTHLSELGRRVLASEDIERIYEAVDKAMSFETRMAGYENKTDNSQHQLGEHQTRLKELAAQLGTNERVIEGHTTALSEVSDKIASLESHLDGFEHNVGEKLRQLLEHKTKVDELAAKLESVEQMADRTGTGLAEANRGIETLAAEIQSLKQFRIATEETRRLIVEAFSGMRAVISGEQGPVTTPQAAQPQETAQLPEERQAESEDPKTLGTYRYP